jgi:hypothetical protein
MGVESDTEPTAHELLDTLLTLHADTSPVHVQAGQIRPQDSGASFIITLSAEAELQKLESVQTDLADALVSIGVETDVNAATKQIRIEKR